MLSPVRLSSVVCLHDAADGSIGCRLYNDGSTTGCPILQPVIQPVGQPVVSCKRGMSEKEPPWLLLNVKIKLLAAYHYLPKSSCVLCNHGQGTK